MSPSTCPHCQKTFDDFGDAFCPECHEELSAPVESDRSTSGNELAEMHPNTVTYSKPKWTGLLIMIGALVWGAGVFMNYVNNTRSINVEASITRENMRTGGDARSRTSPGTKMAILNSQKQAQVHQFLSLIVAPLVAFVFGISLFLLSGRKNSSNTKAMASTKSG